MSSFSAASHLKIEDELAKQLKSKDEYIAKLHELLKEHRIDLPEESVAQLGSALYYHRPHEIKDGSEEEMRKVLEKIMQLERPSSLTLEYTHLSYKVYVPQQREIETVGSALQSMLFFWKNFEPKKEIAILNNVTGRIKPRKMTLLIGPPGSGKSGNHVIIHWSIR